MKSVMRFVPDDFEKVSSLSKALRESLNVDTQEANDLVGILYGFNDWSDFFKTSQSMASTPYDEDVSPTTVMQRHAFYQIQLQTLLDADGFTVKHMLAKLKPSSKEPSESF